MPVKVIANFKTLLHKAYVLGQARQRGNIIEIKEAEADHEAYWKICLEADEVSTGMTHGGFNS